MLYLFNLQQMKHQRLHPRAWPHPLTWQTLVFVFWPSVLLSSLTTSPCNPYRQSDSLVNHAHFSDEPHPHSYAGLTCSRAQLHHRRGTGKKWIRKTQWDPSPGLTLCLALRSPREMNRRTAHTNVQYDDKSIMSLVNISEPHHLWEYQSHTMINSSFPPTQSEESIKVI